MDIDTAKLAIGEILCELQGDKSEQTRAENYAIAEGFLEDFLSESHDSTCLCVHADVT
jgi:hypothetical protein